MNKDKTTLDSYTASNLNDIPKKPHFVVLIQDKERIDDTYGSYYMKDVLEYVVFQDEETLKKWIIEDKENRLWNKPYKVFKVNPVEIQLQTTLTIQYEQQK